MAPKVKHMGSKGKGKRVCDDKYDEDKSGSRKKRKNPGVLKFFEDEADLHDFDSSDDSDLEKFFMEEGFDDEPTVNNEPAKAFNLPVLPKEEDINDEEFHKMMEERYKPGSGFVTYAEDGFEAKRLADRNFHIPSAKDPTIWKVKCLAGRERQSAFCLMQKFVDVQSLGTKLKIISAFTLEHFKGFIFIEADKQCDINEACKGLSSIYSTRVAPIPQNEVSHLLSIRNKYNGISVGMWARVKNGNYKGDLAQVVAVNEARKKATIKLLPRIDLRSMADKIGSGGTVKKGAIPAPRLMNPSELEEFRPLIQYRRDRDTGMVFEVLDSLMLKDGYLFKKVSIDSLSYCAIVPTEEELLKFKPSEVNESDDRGWLMQLYGEQKKKQTIKTGKGDAKGEGSSSSGASSFELFDLVCFGRKDFGLVIDMEKDGYYKILKNGKEGSELVTLEQKDLKSGSIDKKFTALDQRMKVISINDTVKVLEGPFKDRQGIVRHVYRGTVFLYDENETENSGYFCSKAEMCEKIKLSVDASNEKVVFLNNGHSHLFTPPCLSFATLLLPIHYYALGFEDFPSSPKSPLSPKKPWQARENSSKFNGGEKDGMFTIGQTLRIRIGPLKGYICRVIAIRYSDVTVKLDSQQKVLTVKSEHLAEVRGKSSSMYTRYFCVIVNHLCKCLYFFTVCHSRRTCSDVLFFSFKSEDPGSSSFKPFDLLGNDGGSGDWTDRAGPSVEGDGWNAGGLSAGSAWETKLTSNQNSSADEKAVGNSGWAKAEDGWNKAAEKTGSGSGASDSWGKRIASSGDHAAASKDAGDSWGQAKLELGIPVGSSNDAAASWAKSKELNDNQDSWKKSAPRDKGKDVIGAPNWKYNSSSVGEDCWGKGKDVVTAGGSTWGKFVGSEDKGTGEGVQKDCWDKTAEKWIINDVPCGSNPNQNNSTPAAEKPTGGWGKTGGSWSQSRAENTDEESGWKKAKVVSGSQNVDQGYSRNANEAATAWDKGGSCNQDQTDSWNKPEDFAGNGGAWNKQDVGSSWAKQDGGSSWGKQDGGSSWGKQDGGSSRGKLEGGSSWGKQDGGAAWGKEDGGRPFFEGRGTGGRRGRGGGRGGRDQFGRGRSLEQSPSSGWSKESQENNDQAGGWGKPKAFDVGGEDGWKKQNASAGAHGSSLNQGWGADKESGNKWNSVDPSVGNSSSAYGEAGGIGDQGGRNKRETPGENQNNGWKGKASDLGGNLSSGNSSWDTPRVSHEKSSGWNQKSGEVVKTDEQWDHGNGWSGKKIDGDSTSGWSQNVGLKGVANDTGGNQDSNRGRSSDWNSGPSDLGRNQDLNCGKKVNWNSGSSDAGGDQDSGEDQTENGDKSSNWNSRSGDAGNQHSNWGKNGNRYSGSSDTGGNQDSDWGKNSSWNSGSGELNQDSSWGKKSNWNSGGADTNQDSGWGKKSGWNSGNAFGTDEAQTENFRNRASGGSWGGFGGRDGSDRGGFQGRGRGDSDRGGFGGRGRSDRGGYGRRGRYDRGGVGGRGGYDRGGFGVTGRGRREWNNSNDSGEDQLNWKKEGNNNGEGWKTNDGAGSWNQRGGDKDHRQSWTSGGGGTSNQSSRWNSKVSSWNQTAENKDAGCGNNFAGSWSKGTPSTDKTGASQANNWKSSDVSGWGQRSGWNQSIPTTEEPKGTNDHGGDWSKASGVGAQTGDWNNKRPGWNGRTDSGNGGDAGDEAKAWNQSKDTIEGTNGGGEPTDSWGGASAAAAVQSSWGKGGDQNGRGW
ncbi:LOW QUALITY PROTEIN: KOW domain-containing protein/Spt5-NGN domain-containing protein, partial [Cephalotus follicularis]